MKLTTQQIQQIIKEELNIALYEAKGLPKGISVTSLPTKIVKALKSKKLEALDYARINHLFKFFLRGDESEVQFAKKWIKSLYKDFPKFKKIVDSDPALSYALNPSSEFVSTQKDFSDTSNTPTGITTPDFESSARKLDKMRQRFKGKDMTGLNYIDRDWSFYDLRGTKFNATSLNDTNMTKADLRGAHLSHADLIGTNLYDANLSGASLKAANLTRANLHRANLSNANLRGANLTWTKLFNTDLRGADLRGVDLRKTSPEGTNLSGANLTRVNLFNVFLRDVDLSGANLGGANLRDASLRDVDLSGANLGGANLRDASLRRVNLNGANLNDTSLRGANLEGANLSKANLRGANLSGADLRGAIIPKDLEKAIYNQLTIWPQGFDPIKAGAKKV